MIDAPTLLLIVPLCPKVQVDVISSAMSLVFSESKGLDSKIQQAHFIAQVAHETGQFRWVKELGGSDYFRSNYEYREDLGNKNPDDGERFCGRGWAMATGRSLYHELSQHFGIDFISSPYLLEKPEWAAKSAGYFWESRAMGDIAINSESTTLERVSKRWNGGVNGLTERAIFFGRACAALEIP